MEKNNNYDENIELSDSEDVFDFPVLEDIVEDYNSDTSSSSSEIIRPKRRRMIVIESESEESLEDLDEWRDVMEELDIPDTLNFSVSPKVTGPQIPTNIVQLIQYFKLFFTNELEYWSVMENSRIPFFSKIFTRKRFMQIFWMLHLKSPDPAKNDIRTRIQRASNFLEYINSRFSDYFIPEENICVDESAVKFKGKISFITYSPNKPTKRDLLVSTRIALHLYQQLLDRVPTAEGYHMHTDRYYTSILLAEELRKMKCHLTGTIQTNRKGIPTSLKKPKLRENKTVAYKRGNTMLLAWRDKRIVTLLSNWHNAGMITTNRFIRGGTNEVIEKPKVPVGYTKSIGGVDRADQYASSYCFMRMLLKWWRKLFFWGMEMSIINSYILYKTVQHNKNEKALTHLKYRKILVDQLIGDFRQERTRVSRSISEIRLNGKLHIMRKGPKRDCVVCSTRKQRDGSRQTSEYCDTCPSKPRMHMGDCFQRYHTMVNYKI
ncbi:hypothetical protein M0802_013908 [Mischocyttarus mexicanus]|nr:hypothetical protein M0802_013908 [Mischocyttarus mexicanus]